MSARVSGRLPKAIPAPRKPNPLSRLKPVRNPTMIRKARRLCPNKECTEPKVEDGVCHNCGTIVDESNIVAEVQFGETSSGAAMVQGSYVGADQGAAKTMGPGFRRSGQGSDREMTLREGRNTMQNMASVLRISEAVINSGVQIFKLAAMNNFIQGRKLGVVAAVCLYSACRKEKPCRVMLIDFADLLQVNVFKLGSAFKHLHKTVSISKDGILPVVPEDLIYRFAGKLEFNLDTKKVAETAVRLVRRMELDWMVMGRRPSGICGACLIMAARMHNYRRTVKEVVYIVKVTEMTVQKRLEEFKQTASSQLTVEEFMNNEFLESAHDPPSWYQKTEEWQRQKRAKSRKRKRTADADGEDEDDDASERASETPQPDPQPSTQTASLEPELQALPQVQYRRDEEGFIIPPVPPKDIPIDPSLLDEVPSNSLDKLANDLGDATPEVEDDDDDEVVDGEEGNGEKTKSKKPQLAIDQDWENDEQALENEISQWVNDPHTAEHALAFSTAQQRARIHVMMAHANKPPKEVSMEAEIGDDEFANDPEVANCLLSEVEAAIKEKIWVNENKDWLRAKQQKYYRERMAAKGPPKATRNRKKKPRIGEGQTSAAASPAEAAVNALKERAWSKKINYEAIKGMFEGPGRGLGSATTSRVTSMAGSTVGANSVAGSSVADEASDVGNMDDVEEEEVEDDEEEDWDED